MPAIRVVKAEPTSAGTAKPATPMIHTTMTVSAPASVAIVAFGLF